MAATPFTATSSVGFAPSTGQPVASRPTSQSGTFTKKQDDSYELTGSGSKTVTFDANVKVLQVSVESATAPVNLQFNGGSDDLELSAGGFLVYANPIPTSGLLSVTLVHTTDAVVHIVGLS